uniref:Ferritin n=1 Tax=Chrysemys picta bellii TaxID=8478 RepID=A0A8C3P3C9_CHRPI
MESQVRQNFHLDCEAAVNRMVNLELYASYVYLSMSCYFDRDDVALRHMAQFLKEQSHEEREHAEKFLTYQNKRGGRIVLQDIRKPERDEWGNSLEALQCALQLEKAINQALAPGELSALPPHPSALWPVGEGREEPSSRALRPPLRAAWGGGGGRRVAFFLPRAAKKPEPALCSSIPFTAIF